METKENPVFEFTGSGPIGGDETCAYSVKILKEPCTVKDVVDFILTTKKNEWGLIIIYKNGNSFDNMIEYRYGELNKNYKPFDEATLNSTVEHISASGGWTRMDYTLKLKR